MVWMFSKSWIILLKWFTTSTMVPYRTGLGNVIKLSMFGRRQRVLSFECTQVDFSISMLTILRPFFSWCTKGYFWSYERRHPRACQLGNGQNSHHRSSIYQDNRIEKSSVFLQSDELRGRHYSQKRPAYKGISRQEYGKGNCNRNEAYDFEVQL